MNFLSLQINWAVPKLSTIFLLGSQASAASLFVNGTTLNGISDMGQVVGFYSDGTHVNGVLPRYPNRHPWP